MNKGDPKVDAMSEEELARFFEENKGNDGLWEKKPARMIRVRRGGPSHVFTLRLTSEELTAITRAADNEGVTPSEFIRRAAMDRIEGRFAASA